MDITSYLLGKKSSSGGGNISEYFDTQLTQNTNNDSRLILQLTKKLPDIKISNSVNNLSYAFKYSKLTEIPNIDNTSNIRNMSNMFYQCQYITQIPQLDTSNVTDMSDMFYGCLLLITIPQLDTSNVTNMNEMFAYCDNLKEIPLLNCSSVNRISYILRAHTSNALTGLGGFKNLGQSYLTTQNANYSYYTLTLSQVNNLTHDSLMNVINNLYDIATKGCNTQSLVLGSTNLTKLTAEEIAIATGKGWTVS